MPLLLSGDSNPARHQKIDVEIHRRITEYRVHRTICPHCGLATAGRLPEGVSKSGVSENIAALVGVLTGICHLSCRMTQMPLDRLFEARGRTGRGLRFGNGENRSGGSKRALWQRG